MAGRRPRKRSAARAAPLLQGRHWYFTPRSSWTSRRATRPSTIDPRPSTLDIDLGEFGARRDDVVGGMRTTQSRLVTRPTRLRQSLLAEVEGTVARVASDGEQKRAVDCGPPPLESFSAARYWSRRLTNARQSNRLRGKVLDLELLFVHVQLELDADCHASFPLVFFVEIEHDNCQVLVVSSISCQPAPSPFAHTWKTPRDCTDMWIEPSALPFFVLNATLNPSTNNPVHLHGNRN